MNKNTKSRKILLTLAVTSLAACDQVLTDPHHRFADGVSPQTDTQPAIAGEPMAAMAGGYNIELIAVDAATKAFAPKLVAAARVWADILRNAELRDVYVRPGPKPDCHGINIDAFSGTVDELLIIAWVTAIDGVGGTAASAGPCFLRRENSLPFMGAVFLDRDDIADIDDGDLAGILVHEIGHVLGIGALWDTSGFLQSPSLDSPGADTHFSGPLAVAAFDAAGGTSYRHNKVPVENAMGVGGADQHWRESVLDSELMTPVLQRGATNPLSRISIESLADMGYRVDADRAETFTLPAAAGDAVAGHADRSRIISLEGDVLVGPLLAFDAEGNSVRLRRD